MSHFLVRVWFVSFEPENLTGGVSGEDEVALVTKKLLAASVGGCDGFTLGDCGCVAPEFDVVKYVSGCVNGDEAVLLSGDSDCGDARANCWVD